MTTTPLRVRQEPVLLRLFEWWQRSPQSVAISDPRREEEDFTIANLLYDVLSVKQDLYEALSEDARAQLQDPKTDVCIALIAHPGYRYCVLLLAIYALGGVAVPLSPTIHPEEFTYFRDVTNAVLLTAMPEATQRVNDISALTGVNSFIFDKTAPFTGPGPEFVLDADTPPISPDKGLLVIFTSGTTGQPKGILHTRERVTIGIQAWAETLGPSSSDTWLHTSPVNWMAGCIRVFICTASGTRIQFGDGSDTVEMALRYLQRGHLTGLFLAPGPLATLADRLEAIRHSGDLETYGALVSHLRALRVLVTGSMTVSTPLKKTWRDIRGGKHLTVLYGMTESMVLVSATDWTECVDSPIGSSGLRLPQVSIKIANTGEICVKTPGLVKRYLSANPSDMSEKFDSEGFFKTGDIGRLENDALFVLGRASEDVIHHRAWRVYAPEVEGELAEHPQIQQAIVQSVPDALLGDHVAALVVMSDRRSRCQDAHTDETDKLDLRTLREWLALERGMSASKLPTMLRIIQSVDEVPTTASMKPIKRKIREKFFGKDELASGRVEAWDQSWVEPWLGHRPFDWQGKF
ncbi:amp dependent CoA ligase [Aspergillus steynii IBT 23096]|uniref:Amp dependent CoA ligase n=1 Tax=Aspergillus steynii IBT 23096 TaxID=1392250 RepID=A0A2I2G6M3_9EURO|nr:amp dependent CoA ligase [Aspergillus steynii IBT 23096]PLB48527.1 amp dependent CoA ligase [Aspergillus steynii IBT 23096]